MERFKSNTYHLFIYNQLKEGKSYQYSTIYRVNRIKDLIIIDRKYKV